MYTHHVVWDKYVDMNDGVPTVQYQHDISEENKCVYIGVGTKGARGAMGPPNQKLCNNNNEHDSTQSRPYPRAMSESLVPTPAKKPKLRQTRLSFVERSSGSGEIELSTAVEANSSSNTVDTHSKTDDGTEDEQFVTENDRRKHYFGNM